MTYLETLDYDDWHEINNVGHEMIDDATAFLKDLRDGPVWKPMSESDKALFKSPAPMEGCVSPAGLGEVLALRLGEAAAGPTHNKPYDMV